MTYLAAPHEAITAIREALGLPSSTKAFTLTFRAGEPVVLDVEMYADEGQARGLVEVVKRYRLEAVGNVKVLCVCKHRAAADCPGEWEPGCDLGSNPYYIGVGST
jgi:hypothetical protein